MGDTQIQVEPEGIMDTNSPPPTIKISGRGPEKYFTKSIKKLTHANKTLQENQYGEIDEMCLLKKMHVRFDDKKGVYEKSAKRYNYLNMTLAIFMILFQIVLIALNQASDESISTSLTKTVSVILAAITCALIGLMLKMRWGEKSDHQKRGAEAYNQLLRSSTYKLQVLECGGKLGFEGIHDFWKAAIEVEENDVPEFILPL